MLCAEDLLWDVEERHLDEAEFLFEAREAACEAPHFSLDDVATGPDERLLAHLDGLAIAGPVIAERLLLPIIEDPEQDAARIAAATLAICAGCPPSSHARLLGLLDTVEGEQRSGLVRALQLCNDPLLPEMLVLGLSSVRGPGVAARLDVLAGRQVTTGNWLSNFLVSDDLDVVQAAARLARFCEDRRTLEHLGPLAQANEPALRRVTLETALCRQLGGAFSSAVYWAFCPGESPFRRDALVWVTLLGDAAAHERVLGLVDDERHRADALWAVGFSGRMSAVDRCIGLLEDEEFGQLAAEVVCAIAGLPTNEDRFWRAAKPVSAEQALPSLAADDLNADLVPEGKKALPHPNPEEVARWWHARKHDFQPALRYLHGRPLDKQAILHALSQGPMRRRHNLALELACRTAAAASVSTWDWAACQRAQLAGLAGLPEIDCQRGLASG